MYIIYNFLVLINVVANVFFIVATWYSLYNLTKGSYLSYKPFWIIYLIAILAIILIPEDQILRDILDMPVKIK